MMKKLQTLLRAIDPSRAFNDEHEAGLALSPAKDDGGSHQRHAASLRPARLRAPRRPARTRRRSVGSR
ncbi:hypothetical protein [Burkholderia sp. WSM2232]|uniref:hypothetical protein n=1 Tax=Burkholderia sp. WSM2232 TaxID=944436 RepID=UPI00040B511C|nr:hypothetical protein [Burkholderia sp. WSM2232]